MAEQVKTFACDCMNFSLSPRERWEERELLSLRLSLGINRYTVPRIHTPLHVHMHDDNIAKSMI